jgi:hypothetical protein
MIGFSFVYPQCLWLLLLIPLTAGLALLGRRALSRARFWGGLALRILLLLLIILALSGAQLRLPTNTLSAYSSWTCPTASHLLNRRAAKP